MSYATAPDPDDPWNIDFGSEEPEPGSDPRDVAEYLYDVERGQDFHSGDWYRTIGPREARAYCDEAGQRWKQVSPHLRALRATDYARRHQEPPEERTPGGIAINRPVIDGLRSAGWLPMCPRFLTGFSKVTFSHFTTGGDCGKWWCPKCGPPLADALLHQVEERISHLSVVHTAVADHEPKLAGRVRQRHHSAPGSEYFFLRRMDDKDFYVANMSLAPRRGSAAPFEWISTGVGDAMKWLRDTVLVLPGHWDHGWSSGWKPDSPREETDLEDLNEESEYAFYQLNSAQANMVAERLAVEVKKNLGCEVDRVPAARRHEAMEILESVIDMVRRSGFGMTAG